MKNLIYLIIGFVALVSMTSCDAFRTLSKNDGNTSLGKPYELIVVCNQQEWTGALGDTLRTIFSAPVAYVNQDEPLFDIQRTTHRGFTKMVTLHRNILIIKIDPSIVTPRAEVRYNALAAPQIRVTLEGADQAALLQYLEAHGKELVAVLEKAERDRAVTNATRINEAHIAEVIFKTFGFEMNIPKGYIMAKQEADFVWCRLEYPTASQGFAIYSYPYQGKGSLNEKTLLAARNKFMSRIPGPTNGSYMTTAEAFEPDVHPFKLEGRAWIEMRGLWDVESDFMGGPFVSYTTVDAATNRVITIDGYVYSPKLNKRNFLRGVEHLLYMANFPDQKTQ